MVTTTATKTCQIKCVNKRDRPNPHEHITHVGGYGTSQWKITQEEAIVYIENKEWSFGVKPANADSVWVIVATSRYATSGHRPASLDQIGGGSQQYTWHCEAERLGGHEVDNQVEFGWLLDGQVCGLGAVENPPNIMDAELV
jgi:hypothetical protein